MSIDDDRLRELADARWAPTYRPTAEIVARARTLRRRRDAFQAAMAVTLAAVVAAGVVMLQPWREQAAPRPANGGFPVAVSCPAGVGPAMPLAEVSDFVVLPPVTPVTSVEARRGTQECRRPEGTLMLSEDGRKVLGTFEVVESAAMGRDRQAGDMPGRHETWTVAGVRVDVWRVDEPRQLRAYWTALGRTYGAHAESFPYDTSYLESVVKKSIDEERQQQVPGSPRYVHTALEDVEAGAVELTVADPIDIPGPPVGAWAVTVSRENESGYWWEEDGVRHLSWMNVPSKGPATARSLSGTGLTLDRALEIATSLRPTPLTDPRIPRN